MAADRHLFTSNMGRRGRLYWEDAVNLQVLFGSVSCNWWFQEFAFFAFSIHSSTRAFSRGVRYAVPLRRVADPSGGRS